MDCTTSNTFDIWSLVHFVSGILLVYICRRIIQSSVKEGESSILENTGSVVVLAVILHQIHEIFTQTTPGQTFWKTVGFDDDYAGNTNTTMDTLVFTLGVAAALMYTREK